MTTQAPLRTAVLLAVASLAGFSAAQEAEENPQGAPLAERVKVAADSFQPVDEAALVAAKNAAASAVNNLWTYLGTQNSGPGWKSFLMLAELKAEVAKGAASDLAVLENSLARFQSHERGLEMPKFAAARDALANYVALRRAASPDAAAAYKDQMTQLAAALAAYEAGKKVEDLAKAGGPLAWLEERGLATELTAEARAAYWQPNLLVTIDDDLVLAGFGRKVDETGEVSDIIVGARVRGTQHTTGDVVAELVPNEHAAQIRNTFRATAQTQTIGTKSGANVWSSGTTKVAAVKNLFITASGFSTKPAAANAVTHTTPTGVNANRGCLNCIANGIVWKQVRATQNQAEYESARKAEGRVRRRLNSEAEKQLVDANDRFRQRFRKRLEERNAFPNVLNFSTTATSLNIVGLRAGDNELAALEAPPQVEGNPVISARVHESMVNNTARALYGGRKLTRDEFQKEVEEMFDEVPEELKPDPNEPDWYMIFADDPVSVTFDEGLITIVIRGTEFQSGDREPDKIPMDVTVKYKSESRDGGLVLVREGEVDPLPPGFNPDTDTLAGDRLALRRQLQDRYGKIFKDEIVPEPRALEGSWSSAGKLVLDRLDSGGKWITAYFSLDSTPAEMPTPVALRR